MNARSRIAGIRARAERELRGAGRQQQQEIRAKALDEIREVAATAPLPLRRVESSSYFDGPAPPGSASVVRGRSR